MQQNCGVCYEWKCLPPYCDTSNHIWSLQSTISDIYSILCIWHMSYYSYWCFMVYQWFKGFKFRFQSNFCVQQDLVPASRRPWGSDVHHQRLFQFLGDKKEGSALRLLSWPRLWLECLYAVCFCKKGPTFLQEVITLETNCIVRPV